jgi:hypothetical protein
MSAPKKCTETSRRNSIANLESGYRKTVTAFLLVGTELRFSTQCKSPLTLIP